MSIPKNLTIKTATPLAVLCGQRSKEILTVMVICNIEFCSNELWIIRIGDLLQTSNIHFHKGELMRQENLQKQQKRFSC